MALGRPVRDLTATFNSTYNITLDMSGWDKTTIQTVAPVLGTIYIYGSNDAGQGQSVTDGNAQLATNFTTIQATNLASGSAVTAITAAGEYKVDVNAQFLRLQGNPVGSPTNIYRLLLFHSKSS